MHTLVEMDPCIIGKRLRELRGTKARSEVATDLGISCSALAMYEQGERIPRDNIKIKIANYYGQSISAIFYA